MKKLWYIPAIIYFLIMVSPALAIASFMARGEKQNKLIAKIDKPLNYFLSKTR